MFHPLDLVSIKPFKKSFLKNPFSMNRQPIFWSLMAVAIFWAGWLATGIITNFASDLANTWLYLDFIESSAGMIGQITEKEKTISDRTEYSIWRYKEYEVFFNLPDGRLRRSTCYTRQVNPSRALPQTGDSIPIVYTRFWPYYAIFDGVTVKPERNPIGDGDKPFFLHWLMLFTLLALPPSLGAWWFNRKEKVVKRFYLLLFAGSLAIPAVLHGVPVLMKLFR